MDSSGEVRDGEKLGEVYTEATVKSSVNIISNQAYAKFVQKAYAETYSEGGSVHSAMVSTTYDGLKIMPKNGNSFSFEFFGPLKATSEQSLKETYGNDVETEGYATVFQSKPSYESLVKNEASPVMLLEHSSGKYLFTGDATIYAEEAVVNSLTEAEKLRFANVDVFHAGHHGANNSNGDKLLELIKPKMTVISVGEGNRHGHPTPEALDRLDNYSNENIYRTDTQGNILVLANADTIQLKANNVVGNLSQTEVELPPDEYWYVYVAGITLAVFFGGVIFILSNGKIKAKPYNKRR